MFLHLDLLLGPPGPQRRDARDCRELSERDSPFVTHGRGGKVEPNRGFIVRPWYRMKYSKLVLDYPSNCIYNIGRIFTDLKASTKRRIFTKIRINVCCWLGVAAIFVTAKRPKRVCWWLVNEGLACRYDSITCTSSFGVIHPHLHYESCKNEGERSDQRRPWKGMIRQKSQTAFNE